MFNVAVLKMKDIIKYFIGITTMLLVAICIQDILTKKQIKQKLYKK